MSEEQNMIGRTFAYGGNVSVVMTHVHASGPCFNVTVDGSDGSGFKVDNVTYDGWMEITDFVRDSARRLTIMAGKEWDGHTVKDVAIDILERYREFSTELYREEENRQALMADLDKELSAFHKRLNDAELADFNKAIEPLRDTADERQNLVRYALQGVIDAFEQPDEPPAGTEGVLLTAYVEGLEVGKALYAKYPDPARMLNAFIQVFTAMGMYTWHAFGGKPLDEEDTAEFGHVFHGLFYKFANKPRPQIPEPPTGTTEAMMAAVKHLIAKKQRAKDAGQQREPHMSVVPPPVPGQ